ncbi:hypothetical protein OIU80_11410 [Flavobacterium sp. LS1R47]|uniref:Uncharacterized protein n=1 Tax=Flavobacterium frigoritolerans TaxID=2987686 RepID=A0A9X3C838_9FLAO|nr:hypothetical protein [Flavobacterium frigoritolerans]MCV9932892.1 hypothetical protein [Flavobacterium frigoritolerans]
MKNEISIATGCKFHIDSNAQAIVETANPSNTIPLERLPTHEIEGTTFYVVINSQALIETTNLTNTISFHDMKDHGTHYSMCYHSEYKNFPCQLDAVEDTININIPPLLLLDSEGMTKKYGVTIESLKNKTDLEFLNPNYEGFMERVAGILPHIDIAGQDFIIDLNLKELRLAEDPFIKLEFKDFEIGSFDGDFAYHFLYDTKLQKLVGNESSKDVIQVELPNLLYLDPVGLARRNGHEDSAYIRDYPIEKNLKATTYTSPLDVKKHFNKQTFDSDVSPRKRGKRL